jgi:hypothetical protein
MKKLCEFCFTTDNDAMAIEEVTLGINGAGMTIDDLKITNSTHACRNANGKELSEEEFNGLAPDDDNAWFDDYDYVLTGIVGADTDDEDKFKELLNKCGGTIIEERKK